MRINVGVLRGGPSDEYEVSLKSGAEVLRNLSDERYRKVDLFIDKSGNWHSSGVCVPIEKALNGLDVVFNALHGSFGEDGGVQRILDSHGIPYTGSGMMASVLGMNKVLSKNAFKDSSIKTPYHILLSQEAILNELDPLELENLDYKVIEKGIEKFSFKLFRSFPMPAVIKPVSSGSSAGVFLAMDYDSLVKNLLNALKISDEIMIEEYISGREATCGVIERFRNHDIYALPPIEIRPHNKMIFDYESKYQGKSDEICPANFSSDEKMEIEKLSRLAHKSLGLSHYSRSDFKIHPKRGIFILEANSLPGLTKESLLPKALKAVGSTVSHFVDHVIDLALSKNKKDFIYSK